MDDIVGQHKAPWGLDRIDENALPLDGKYAYDDANGGSVVVVYILDTGILQTHAEFGTRAVCNFSAIEYEDPCFDGSSHGSHVAGVVGGSTFGVAKQVTLESVKVLDANGQGTFAGVLAGLDYVLASKEASPETPMVMNLSLGGGFSAILNDAVNACVAGGIVAVVSAGNSRQDACNYSPGSSLDAITVAATAKDDTLAPFSNQGSCVDLLAPGVDIPSASSENDFATRILSGTSMAAPHVAGAAALYLQNNPMATPKEVGRVLVQKGIGGKVNWLYPESGTPNVILRTKKLL